MNNRALVAEFIGTFFLIFVGTIAISVAGFPDTGSGLTGIAFAHGLTIMVMVSATAAISGGHLNPAVTCGLWVLKKIDNINAVGYIAAQLIGATIGALLANLVFPTGSVHPALKGIPALGNGTTIYQGIVIEAIATFALVFVVLGTAVDKRAPKMGGLFIGLTITLGILWSGPLTGGAINPARWFGPALVDLKFDNALVWIVGPVIGGILAALAYKAIAPEIAETD